MAISVEQAILRMLEHTPILNSEQVPLEELVCAVSSAAI